MADDKTPAPAHRERAIGPEALKAFAHPLRMALYDALVEYGSATATMLARRLGESTGQTSYHLRQLERHGFVEDDPDKPSGRERWWRSIGFSLEGRSMLEDPSIAAATGLVLQRVIDERTSVLAHWMTHPDTEPEWAEVGINQRATVGMTADELQALITELEEVVDRHVGAARSTDVPGRRRVRLYLDAFPLPRADEDARPSDTSV